MYWLSCLLLSTWYVLLLWHVLKAADGAAVPHSIVYLITQGCCGTNSSGRRVEGILRRSFPTKSRASRLTCYKVATAKERVGGNQSTAKKITNAVNEREMKERGGDKKYLYVIGLLLISVFWVLFLPEKEVWAQKSCTLIYFIDAIYFKYVLFRVSHLWHRLKAG